MQKRKHAILGLLTFCLTATLLVGVTSSAGYDPWCDVNDDGIIDIVDIVSLAIRFGEEGEPCAAKAAQEYDSGWLNITDKQGQYFNVTHNLNLVNQSVIPRLYGKQNAESPPSSEYWFGFGLPGWNQTYGGTESDEGYSVVQTGDGGYAIAGSTTSFGAGSDDVYLVKTDSNGNMEWNQTYGTAEYDHGESVVQTGDGGYAIAGRTGSYDVEDVYLVKTYSNGTMEWNQTYGGTDMDVGESVVQTVDGGYAIVGYTGMMPYDVYFVKTYSNGTMEWNQTYGDWDTFDWGFSVVQTVDGGYAIGGTTGYMGVFDFYLVKTDSNGNMEWNQTYGGTDMDYGMSVVQTDDGGYAIAGYTLFAGGVDVHLVKTDPFGLVEPKTGLWITSVDADALTLYRGTVAGTMCASSSG
jgi:hypothetical protein